MSLVVHGSAETVEASDSEGHYDYHESQAILRFVDPFVSVSQLQAYPVVQGAGYCFADDAEYEGTQRGQAGLSYGEVVRRGGEQNSVHDREHDDPGQGCSVEEEAEEHCWVEEHDEWAGEYFPGGAVRVSSCVDAETPEV
jgi:hypothetical protein